VSMIGIPELDDLALSRRVLEELGGWFGAGVAAWDLLRVYRIAHALPVLTPEASSMPNPTLVGGVFVCGDYREDPSINGALISGRKAAECVVRMLSGT
jgi:predicted NAD/FAD-dependent oxidoreductase